MADIHTQEPRPQQSDGRTTSPRGRGPQTGNFLQHTADGLFWSAIGKVSLQFIAFVITITLARLLSPHEFGLLAMVTVFLGYLQIYTLDGFSAAIIQHPELEDSHLDTAFWMTLALSLFFATLFLLCAPLLSAFYDEPVLIPLGVLLASIFPLNALSGIQRAILRKALAFKTISLISTVSASIAGGIAILLAAYGFGVWSLAAQLILNAGITTIGLWWKTHWKPRFFYSRDNASTLLHFSFQVWGSSSFTYFVRNVDDLLIGRFLGAQALGNYTRAYTLMFLPVYTVSDVFGQVMLPSLSILSNKKTEARKLYLDMTGCIALLTFPVSIGMFVVAEPFVLTLLGDQWLGCIPILRILSLLGVVQSIQVTAGSLYRSQGRPELELRVSLFTKPLVVAGIVIGLAWGTTGVAWGYALGCLLVLLPEAYFAGSVIDLPLLEFGKNFLGILGCGALMALGIIGLIPLLPDNIPSVLVLTIEILWGGALYVTLVRIFNLHAYRRLREVIATYLIKR